MIQIASSSTDKRLSPDHAMRLALALWASVVVAVAVKSIVAPERHSIFPILSTAVDHFWHDQPLYDDYKPLDYFRYPPLFAVYFTPLARLGPMVGSIVWTWLGMGVFLLGLWRLGQRVAPTTWTSTHFALFLALGCIGGVRGFWNAQANALVTGLILLGLVAWIDGRWWPAAWYLAAAVVIKLTPLALVLLLIALKPRALLIRVSVIIALLGLVPFLTKPPDVILGHYRDLFTHLSESSRERWPGFRDAWTVYQVIVHQASGLPGIPPLKTTMESTLPYRTLQLLSAGAVLAWCLWQKRLGLSTTELATRTLGMGMAWLMLFGPSTEHPTYVFLAPSLALALLQNQENRWNRWIICTSAALILVLGWSALTEGIQNLIPWTLTALPVGTACYIFWLIADSWPSVERDDLATPHRVTLPMAHDEGVPRQLAA